MLRFVLGLFGPLFCATLIIPLQTARAEPVSPVVLAQPAVFRLQVALDAEIDFPELVTTDLQLLHTQYNKAALDGALGGLTEPEFHWHKLAENPAMYLKPSAGRTRLVVGKMDASGSAFAVSEEGILVTNAHMVSDGGDELLQDPKSALALLSRPFEREWDRLTKQFGGSPREAEGQRAAFALVGWLAAHSKAKTSFKSVHVVMRYYPAEKSLLSTIPEVPAHAVEATARVLAVGASWPGKDVAILKIEPRSITFMGHDIIGRKMPEVVNSLHLICLPTADSDNVLPGTHVHALGFPGVAVGPEMALSALYVVNSQPGEVGQPLEMKEGWKSFPLTANIDHGDSGGPVVDDQGKAIAINVAGMQPGYNSAVPINLATALLREANITPKCSLNEAWEKAVQLFFDKKYTDAANALERIARSQADLDGIIELTRVDMQNLPTPQQQAEASLLFLRPKGHEHPGVSASVLELESKAAAVR